MPVDYGGLLGKDSAFNVQEYGAKGDGKTVSDGVMVTTPIAAPTVAASAAAANANMPVGTYTFTYTYIVATGETLVSPASSGILTSVGNPSVVVTFGAIPAGASGVKIYVASGPTGAQVGYTGSNPTSGTSVTISATPGTPAAPGANTANVFLQSATAGFVAADAGKLIVIGGGGAAGVVLSTTIATYVNATTVTLTVGVSTTTHAQVVAWASDDTAAFTALANKLNATTYLTGATAAFGWIPSGIYGIAGAIPTLTNIQTKLRGAGSDLVSLMYTGNSDCLRFQQGTFQNHPPSPLAENTGPQIGGFTIDGRGAGASGVGLHYGDVVGGQLGDLVIQHFTGASAIGLWMHSAVGFTERTSMNSVRFSNCAICIKWSKNDASATTVSFGYTRMLDVQFEINNGQKGMSFVSSGANSLGLYNSTLFLTANLGGTSTFIEVTGNAQVFDCLVSIVAEAPATCTFLNINDAGNAIWRTFGVLIAGAEGGLSPMGIVGTVQGLNAGYQTGGAGPLNAIAGGAGGGVNRARLQLQNGPSAWLASLYQDSSSTVGITNGGADCLTITSAGVVTVPAGALVVSKDLRHSKQSPAFNAAPTPDAALGEIYEMAALTGAVSVGNPVNSAQGQRIRFYWKQDGTGGRTVTYTGSNWRSVGIAAQTTTLSTYTIDEAECLDGTIWRVVRLVTGQTI